VFLALMALALGGGGTSETPRRANAQEPGLTVEDLRQGGYVIFFRHMHADDGQDASPTVNLDDCTTQRNLSLQGLRDARTVGQAFRVLRIPVGQVHTSEYCRAIESARIAFGRAEPDPRLNFCCPDTRPFDQNARVAFLYAVLVTVPPTGVNTVIVGHAGDIMADLEMGEAGIYLPDGAGNFQRVARVRPGEWMSGIYPPGGARPVLP
jgi:phosphohistidine phosphatase SixA